MGVAIKIPTEDRAYSATKLAFPVAGASYMNVFGDNAGATARNLAIGATAVPVVTGTPTVESAYAVMTSETNFVNTGVVQPSEFTFLCVARPEADNGQAPMITNAGGSGKIATAFFFNEGTSGDSQGICRLGVATTAGASVLSQTGQTAFSAMPAAFLGSYRQSSRVKELRNLTSGLTDTASAETNEADPGVALLIGSSYNASYPVAIRIYFAAIWARVLSSDERTAAHAWLTDFYSRKHGITV